MSSWIPPIDVDRSFPNGGIPALSPSPTPITPAVSNMSTAPSTTHAPTTSTAPATSSASGTSKAPDSTGTSSASSTSTTPNTLPSGFRPPAGPRIVRLKKVEEKSTPVKSTHIILPSGIAAHNLPFTQRNANTPLQPSRIPQPVGKRHTAFVLPRGVKLPNGQGIPLSREVVTVPAVNQNTAVSPSQSDVIVDESDVVQEHVEEEVPMKIQITRAIHQAIRKDLFAVVEEAVQRQMAQFHGQMKDASTQPHPDIPTSSTMLRNFDALIALEKEQIEQENISKHDSLARLAQEMAVVREEAQDSNMDLSFGQMRDEVVQKLELRRRGNVILAMQNSQVAAKTRQVTPEIDDSDNLAPVNAETATSLVAELLPAEINKHVANVLNRKIVKVAQQTTGGPKPVVVRPDGTLSLEDIERQRPQARDIFKFSLDFHPNIGSVAIFATDNGMCERFLKAPNARKQGFEVCRCTNCKCHRDKEYRKQDKAAGKKLTAAERRENGGETLSVMSYAYVKHGVEPNVFRMLDDYSAQHNRLCMENKVSMAVHAVQFFFNRALYEYGIKPHGTPYEAFFRCYNAVPEIIGTMFPTADPEQWKMAMPSWFSDSNPWHKAFSRTFPRFDWVNPDRAYLFTRLGQANGAEFGEKFIQHLDEQEQFIFCCSDSGASRMVQSSILITDGTFKAVAGIKGMTQMFSIHARHDSGEYKVGAVGFFANKFTATYTRFFKYVEMRMLQNNGGRPFVKVKQVMADWEAGITAGLKPVFPDVKRRYCCFHYSQSISRNVGTHGLKKPYRARDPIVVPYINQWLGGMFMPQQLIGLYANLVGEVPWHSNPTIRANLESFRNYAFKTYLATPQLQERLDAFGIKHGDPRTSNPAEGWHNMIYRTKRIGGCSLQVVMAALVDIDFEAAIRWVQLNGGKRPKYRKKEYVELDDKIRDAKIKLLKDIKNKSGAELDVIILKWSRYASYLLGGSKHKILTGKTRRQLRAERKAAKLAKLHRSQAYQTAETAFAAANADDLAPVIPPHAILGDDSGDSSVLGNESVNYEQIDHSAQLDDGGTQDDEDDMQDDEDDMQDDEDDMQDDEDELGDIEPDVNPNSYLMNAEDYNYGENDGAADATEEDYFVEPGYEDDEENIFAIY